MCDRVLVEFEDIDGALVWKFYTKCLEEVEEKHKNKTIEEKKYRAERKVFQTLCKLSLRLQERLVANLL